jgi:amino acid transporter
MTSEPETDADKDTLSSESHSINIGDLNWIGCLLLLAIIPLMIALAFPLINWFQALLPDNWEKGAAQMLAIPLVIIGLLVFSAVSYLLAHFGISIFKKR